MLIVIFMTFVFSLSQAQVVTVQGVVRDSLSGSAIEFATVRFNKTTIGKLTDEKGRFYITNRLDKTEVIISLMGYQTKTVVVAANQKTQLDIVLSPLGVALNEVVIKPGRERYSKKNNPAVDLIKKVIERKYTYLPSNQPYYTDDEYEKVLLAINDYDPNRSFLKSFKFLPNYADSSKIDNKRILPLSIRESLSNVYYRKKPKDQRRIITAYRNEGIDKQLNSESIDQILKQVFTEVNVTDNNINILLRDFVGPLSSTASVDFYKWYIIDTVTVKNKKYVNLGFVPFNSRDIGFTGNIYVTADTTYAVKQVSFRVPSKINLNYVEEMLVTQEFNEVSPSLWIPSKFTTAIEFSLYNLPKGYIEKERVFSNFRFDLPVDLVFQLPAPETFLKDYKKHDAEFWRRNKPPLQKEYRMDDMMEDFNRNKFLKYSLKTVDILSANYIATHKDEDKNKVDLGTTLTFYSFNLLEGNRFRLTANTNSHFHKHLYLYGYGAYGTRDGKFKYYGEATWAFNDKQYHKDEFPRRNFSVAYKNDVNALGQRYLQAERDNIFMSFNPKKANNLTYDRMAETSYLHESYSGFGYSIYGRWFDKTPAGDLKFEYVDENGDIVKENRLAMTELGLNLRYAPGEKFFQHGRKRREMPSKSFILSLSHAMGLKNVFGSQFQYHKSALVLEKGLWIAPFGKMNITLNAEKIWGQVPFTMLLSGNANTSFTIQKGSFFLLKPLEFINDAQATLDLDYRMGGWFFNRIPFLKALKWRETFGFRALWGSLSEKNNPKYTDGLMLFPDNVYTMGKTPYLEYNVGVQNIFQFFRIDYVRRLNYLDNQGVDKSGFRIGFEASF